jgi:hypothetical protein
MKTSVRSSVGLGRGAFQKATPAPRRSFNVSGATPVTGRQIPIASEDVLVKDDRSRGLSAAVMLLWLMNKAADGWELRAQAVMALDSWGSAKGGGNIVRLQS